MALIATTGAMCMCTCGACPAIFNATPSPYLCGKLPTGTIMDNIPMLNFTPFGACACKSGYPCSPVTPAPWIPMKPSLVTSSKKPILTVDCQLQCMLGGIIKFVLPAEFLVVAK